uniref:Uncharacterized protein n=1 Tax=Aegilops tauschii subsp. strangulata TaxID=200361 RepID=A0A453JH34_AEGTS
TSTTPTHPTSSARSAPEAKQLGSHGARLEPVVVARAARRGGGGGGRSQIACGCGVNATLGELRVKNGLGRTPQMGYFHAAIQLLLSPLCFFSFPCPVVDLKTF